MQAREETAKNACCIQSDLPSAIAAYVNIDVCGKLPTVEFGGHFYCILHLPNRAKAGTREFVDTIKTRILQRDTNFSYIYVPDAATFFNYTFNSATIFNNATFDGQLILSNRTFEYEISFKEASFLQEVDFSSSKFLREVRFDNAIFKGSARFQSALFQGSAGFDGAVFNDFVNFDNATLLGHFSFEYANCKGRAYFNVVRFLGSAAQFSHAVFGGKVEFHHAIFLNETHLRAVEFAGEAHFFNASFPDVVFFDRSSFNSKTSFSGTFFESSSFIEVSIPETGDVMFEGTLCCGDTNFENAEIRGSLKFIGDAWSTVFLDNNSVTKARIKLRKEYEQLEGRYRNAGIETKLTVLDDGEGESSITLQNAEIGTPDRISFFRTRLRPNWFVNSDPRKITFIDVFWEHLEDRSVKTQLNSEINELRNRRILEPARLLEITFSQLAVNAEENNRYKEASKFRFLSFETERLEMIYKRRFRRRQVFEQFLGDVPHSNLIENLKSRFVLILRLIMRLPFDFIHLTYRWLSGYGERWLRAFVWLVVIWIVFALVFWQVGSFDPDGLTRLTFQKSFEYSLQVMTFQKPDPHPHGLVTAGFYAFETIFAPLQAALLALAIRRKFMR